LIIKDNITMKTIYDDRGTDLFKPLIDKGLAPRDIVKRLGNRYTDKDPFNHNKAFNTIPPTAEELLQYNEKSKKYNDDHKETLDHFKNTQDTIGLDEHLKNNPVPRMPRISDRPPLSKALGRFTIDALSKINNPDFYGLTLDSQLSNNYGPKVPLKGLLKTIPHPTDPSKGKGRSVVLNPAYKTQDILSTLVHEGNHAIEAYNPYINKTLQDFLNKKLSERQSNLPKDYLFKLYKGIQDIINLNRDFTIPYKIDSVPQNQEINKEKVEGASFNDLTTKFEEIPAFALETLMRKQYPWIINENTNDDSRKLLRRIMKEQQQQYRNLGLVDANQPEEVQEGSARYKYNNARVPIYTPSADRPNYNLVDKVFIDKIEALRKPLERRKTFKQTTTTSPTPSQSFQNPITQGMAQNQSPYHNNQLIQLMNNQGDINQNLTSTPTPTPTTNYYNTQPYFSRNPKSGNRYLPSTNGKYSNLLLGNRYHPYARPEIGVLRNKS
jgi:hypothetical protein